MGLAGRVAGRLGGPCGGWIGGSSFQSAALTRLELQFLTRARSSHERAGDRSAPRGQRRRPGCVPSTGSRAGTSASASSSTSTASTCSVSRAGAAFRLQHQAVQRRRAHRPPSARTGPALLRICRCPAIRSLAERRPRRRSRWPGWRGHGRHEPQWRADGSRCQTITRMRGVSRTQGSMRHGLCRPAVQTLRQSRPSVYRHAAQSTPAEEGRHACGRAGKED